MSLRAISSTTTTIGAPEFRRTSASLPAQKYSQARRGFIPAKYPVYPLIPLKYWETNTALELKNIVYPDGTPKNSTAAQERVNDEREKAVAGAKIADLRNKQTNAPQAARDVIQKQIDALEFKYFKDERADQMTRGHHGEVLNEFQNSNVNLGQIRVSANGHARQAELERQAIVGELQRLVAMGLVSRPAVPVSSLASVGPAPMGASTPVSLAPFSKPAGSSKPVKPVASTASASSSTPVSPVASKPQSAPSSSSQPTPSATSSTVPSPTSSVATSAAVGPTFPDEEKSIDGINTAFSGTASFDNYDDIVSVLSSGRLSREDQAKLSNLAKGELDRIDNQRKNKKVIEYMTKLVLISEGGNPDEYDKINIHSSVKRLSAVRDGVLKYLRGGQ